MAGGWKRKKENGKSGVGIEWEKEKGKREKWGMA